MPQDVKIMTWNIQNFGKTKGQFNDILMAISDVILYDMPDIVVVLEVNTTKQEMARELAHHLGWLLHQSVQGNLYSTVVLSPNTEREFYAFFVRDSTRTIPLLPVTAAGLPVTVTGSPNPASPNRPDIENVYFTAPQPWRTPELRVLEGFSLMSPDLPRENYHGYTRSASQPVWNSRLPVLGMFWCPDGSPGNQLLPIVACHFVPNDTAANQQFKTAQSFKLLRGIAPQPQPGQNLGALAMPPLQVWVQPLNTLPPTRQTVNFYVLTGDFNIDYHTQREGYRPLWGNVYPELGADALNPLLADLLPANFLAHNTHLIDYRTLTTHPKNTAEELAIKNFDNFFLRINPAINVSATVQESALVITVPGYVQDGDVILNQSLSHYGELDQRGFSSDDTLAYGVDYFRQLFTYTYRQRQPITTAAALVGARVLSDHLPVICTISVQ
jgi:hypothetical protein